MMFNIKNILGTLLVFTLSLAPALAKDLRFIQISEALLSENNTDTLNRVIQDANKQKNVEFIIFSGDNIASPTKDNLKLFSSYLKKIKVPCYVALGDKDVNRYKDMSKKEYFLYLKRHGLKQKTPNYIFEKRGMIFMIVDGSKDVIPSSNGFYKDDVLEWVDANLELYSKKNVIILQHFPLIPPENRESHITFKPEKYLQILNQHKNVKAVISGHFGVDSEKNVDGILHITSKSVPSYRIIDIIDYDTSVPTIWAQTKTLE